ncbi:MAG: hypothetical protein ABIQ95_00760, partial [Bdellovibrionia bacterium]
MRYLKSFPALLLIFLIVAGCNKNELLTSAPGAYRGSVIMKRSGHTSQTLIASQINVQSKSQLEIKSSSIEDGKVTTIGVRAESKKKIRLLLPDWENLEILLTRSIETCFESKADEGTPSATVCFNGLDLTIDLNWGPGGDAFTLSVSQETAFQHPIFEKPKSYSVLELIDQAVSQNFDSAIQFEHVIQAKLTTETAYLNLVPHISLGSALNLATLTPIGYLKTVGDLVPFLFPTRWLQAREAHYRSEAEFDAWILAKANAANVTEGLAYGVLRDEAILAAFNEQHKCLQDVLERVKGLELSDRIQPGASDDIEIIINSVDQGIVILRSTLVQEKMALAQACGFYNFAAITDVESTAKPSLRFLRPYDEIAVKKMSDMTIDRSYELRQINALIKVARLGKTERQYQWLDPTGDQTGGLGISLAPYVKIGISQIQELIIKRQKLESELISGVARAVTIANQSLESYLLAEVALGIDNRRIDRQLYNLKAGVNWSLG